MPTMRPALLAALALLYIAAAQAARLIDVGSLGEHASLETDVADVVPDATVSLRRLMQGAVPSPRKWKKGGKYSPKPAPIPSTYGTPSPAPSPSYNGLPSSYPGSPVPPPYYGYGVAPSPSGLISSPGGYGGVTFVKTCAPPGATIKALPLDPKNPFTRVDVRNLGLEGAASLCEDLCIAQNKCKAYYLRTEGKCFLMKNFGSFAGTPVDPSDPNEYATYIACQIDRTP